jgi:hypothetical protein
MTTEIPTEPDPAPRRRMLATVLKVGVSLVGLALVVANFEVAEIVAAMAKADWRWLVTGAVLIAASLIVRAFRWHIVLSGAGAHIRFSRLVELYLVGSFFNAFLPSGLGGDVVRAAEASQDVDAGVAIGTVVVDRLSGLMALFAMALAVLPWRPPDFPEEVLVVIVLLCVGGLAIGFLLIDGRAAVAIARRLPARMQAAAGNALIRTVEAIRQCGRPSLAGALAVSVLFNLIQIAWWAATGRALGLDVPVTYYLLVVPILALALLVPSIGGLGVRESLAPFLFSGAGISPAEAVALTLLVFGLERVASLLGAPVYIISALRDARRPPAEDEVAPQR